MLRFRIKEKEVAFPIWPIIVIAIVLVVLFTKSDSVSYNELYNEAVETIQREDTEITVSKNVTDNIIRGVGYRIVNGSPDYFHVVNHFSYIIIGDALTITISYNDYASDYEKNYERYNSMLDSIIAQMDEDFSDYEKVLWLHDYIVDNYSYDYSYNSYSSLSMLDEKTGICSSYSLLFKGLLDKIGIKNKIVIGKTEGGYGPTYKLGLHCWNVVKIGMFWYHIDTTWDATGKGKYTNFMVSDSYMKKNYHYSWFFVDGKKCYCLFTKNESVK